VLESPTPSRFPAWLVLRHFRSSGAQARPAADRVVQTLGTVLILAAHMGLSQQ